MDGRVRYSPWNTPAAGGTPGPPHDVTVVRVDELLANREARSSVEARYLDGHPALFPDIAAAFEEQLQLSQGLAVLAVRLAELDGVDKAEPGDPDAVSTRATTLVADLVEPAKSDALEKLGEGEPAFRIARDWLRSKMAPRDGPPGNGQTVGS